VISFRQLVVPRSISLSGLIEFVDTLVVIGMPVAIDYIDAQLSAPASLVNAPSGLRWNDANVHANVTVQLYHPPDAIVFAIVIPVQFRERKTYYLDDGVRGLLDPDRPLLVRAFQNWSADPDTALPTEARVDLTVHMIPDFYEG
jgi:hypothetical protein